MSAADRNSAYELKYGDLSNVMRRIQHWQSLLYSYRDSFNRHMSDPVLAEDVDSAEQKMLEAIREQAAKSAPCAAVPDGWVAVPREPTEEMLRACFKRGAADRPSAVTLMDSTMRDLYLRMLSAAPPSPQADAWVSVEERLPAHDNDVHWMHHISPKEFYQGIGNYVADQEENFPAGWYAQDGETRLPNPTHWRELPAPPQPEAKAKE